MEWLVELVILFVILGLLNRLLSGATRGSKPPSRPVPGEAAGEGAPRGEYTAIEEWLARQMGIELERPGRKLEGQRGSKVGQAAEPARAEGMQRPVRRPPPQERRGRRGAIASKLEQPEPGVVSLEELAARERGQPVSLERRGLEERGAAISMETSRLPADHDRFHERYGIPEPPATHEEFERRYVERGGRAGVATEAAHLPALPNRTQLQRAVIWSEILGPPRALR